MRRLLRRLISRLYAERARLRRRAMGVAAQSLEYLALDLASPARPGPPLPPGVAIALVDDAELARAPMRYTNDAANVDLARAEGHRCIVARAGNEIAARVWVSDRDDALDRTLGGRFAHLQPAVVTFDHWTDSAWRGCGLHRALLARVADEGRRQGKRHVVLWVAAWNDAARRNYDRLGFRPVAPSPE